MNYSATKIYLTCDEQIVREWAAYMRHHQADVARSLSQEGVRHELWFMGKEAQALYVIGVMDVDDHAHSVAVAQTSTLGVDRVHKEFKKHWDRTRIESLAINPNSSPSFEGCELLLDVRP